MRNTNKKLIGYEAIADLMLRYPDLTANGFNTGYSLSVHCHDLGKAIDDFSYYQKQLLRDVDAFNECVRYLQNTYNVKLPICSYKLKHLIERELHKYISNGTLIAAALYLDRIDLRSLGKDYSDPNAIIQPYSPRLAWLK